MRIIVNQFDIRRAGHLTTIGIRADCDVVAGADGLRSCLVLLGTVANLPRNYLQMILVNVSRAFILRSTRLLIKL